MKTEKLFRETPFGGYKRDDVLEYIESLDTAHKAALDELDGRILELNEALSEAKEKHGALTAELEIKTAYAAETDALKQELQNKDEYVEQLLEQCKQLTEQTQTVVEQCEALTAELEKTRTGFTCEKLQGGVCAAVTERAEQILAQAEADAKKRISDAEEQASGIVLRARMDAQEILAEAQGQTEALARRVSDEAHEIISMTVREAKGLIDTAKEQRDDILSDSARSIGKIKGNLSSMQMVVRTIENELRSAKESLAEGITKKEV